MVKNPNFEPTDGIESGSSHEAQGSSDPYKILSVLISGGNQNPVTIVIRKYQYGDSVAKLVNLCSDLTITLKQKYSDTAWQLEPMREMFFVWPDLIKSTRELYWNLADAVPTTSSNTQNYEPIKLTKSGNDKYQFMVPSAAASAAVPQDMHSTSTKMMNVTSDNETLGNKKKERFLNNYR